MKSIIFILSLFILLLLQSCKKYNDKDLYGNWSGSINSWCDSNNYNAVTIDFEKNDIAYLNYNKDNIRFKWDTPYQCKWDIIKKKDTKNSDDNKHWFLYIIRLGTLSDPCYVPCINCPNGNSYFGVCFPDTTQYIIDDIQDNSIKLTLVRKGFTNTDLLFSE